MKRFSPNNPNPSISRIEDDSCFNKTLNDSFGSILDEGDEIKKNQKRQTCFEDFKSSLAQIASNRWSGCDNNTLKNGHQCFSPLMTCKIGSPANKLKSPSNGFYPSMGREFLLSDEKKTINPRKTKFSNLKIESPISSSTYSKILNNTQQRISNKSNFPNNFATCTSQSKNNDSCSQSNNVMLCFPATPVNKQLTMKTEPNEIHFSDQSRKSRINKILGLEKTIIQHSKINLDIKQRILKTQKSRIHTEEEFDSDKISEGDNTMDQEEQKLNQQEISEGIQYGKGGIAMKRDGFFHINTDLENLMNRINENKEKVERRREEGFRREKESKGMRFLVIFMMMFNLGASSIAKRFINMKIEILNKENDRNHMNRMNSTAFGLQNNKANNSFVFIFLSSFNNSLFFFI